MKQIQLSVPDGKRVEWQEVDGKTIAVLVDEEVKDDRPVTERIKTFEDACVALNKRAEAGDETAGDLLADYESNRDNILCKEMLACMKLFIIVAALNEGWEPKFEKDECRYYPWFRLYTKDEYEKLSEEEKGRAVLRSGNNSNAYYGVASALVLPSGPVNSHYTHASSSQRNLSTLYSNLVTTRIQNRKTTN